MSALTTVERELIAARPYFMNISPGPTGLVRHRAMKYIGLGLMAAKKARQLRKGKDPAEIAGDILAGAITKEITKPVRTRVAAFHRHIPHIPQRDITRKNGIGGRFWYYKPTREKMVIIFHDANRAGPHIDVHLGRLSVIRRVKPEVYDKLKFNREGQLTQDSQRLLLNFLKEEIDNGSRIPQNLDHSRRNARASWTGGSRQDTHYGAATTRQVILEEEIEIYKAHAEGPIEFYAPSLNAHRGMYLYRLYKGTDTRAPICIWGNLKNNPPALDDRLHLTLTHPEDIERLNGRVDLTTSTAKYDGSSCYVVIDKNGTTVWSPRTSVRTGEQIEYTFKLDGIANITSEQRIVAMGELLFSERTLFPFGRRRLYLPQSVGSGILNGNGLLPKHIKPEIRLYRVDRIGQRRTLNLDFWENRALQKDVAKLHPILDVVEEMSPEKASRLGFEGFVVVPENGSVNEGFKVKWWMDPHDWRIDKISFLPGAKGGQAGVIHCTSLDSGKKFKLGPGQVGDRALTEAMMARPEDYEGAVLRVKSRHGHEGRASKVIDFHDDKGGGASPLPPGETYYKLDPNNPYYYYDDTGNVLFRVRRKDGRFTQEHPTPGGWKPGRNGSPDVLYQLPELLQRKDEPVYIAEGEKDVNRLRKEGLLATTNPQGAEKWSDVFSELLEGREIYILPDNDAVGHKHAYQVARSVSPYARSVKVVHLPGLEPKGDIYDWLRADHTIQDLQEQTELSPYISTSL